MPPVDNKATSYNFVDKCMAANNEAKVIQRTSPDYHDCLVTYREACYRETLFVGRGYEAWLQVIVIYAANKIREVPLAFHDAVGVRNFITIVVASIAEEAKHQTNIMICLRDVLKRIDEIDTGYPMKNFTDHEYWWPKCKWHPHVKTTQYR